MLSQPQVCYLKKITYIMPILDTYHKYKLRCDGRKYCIRVIQFSQNCYEKIRRQFFHTIAKKIYNTSFGPPNVCYPTKNTNLSAVEDIIPGQ